MMNMVFFNCQRDTELFYKGNLVYRCYKDWWHNAKRYVTKMYYEFKPITTKIGEGNDLVSKESEDTYKLRIDKESYEFITSLEKKLISMQEYYDRSNALNIASWTSASFFTFGAYAGHAATAAVQAVSLTTTTGITQAELNKTKSKLNKYWSFYNSKEYDVLYFVLENYNNCDFLDKDTIEISIKIYWNYFEIKDYFGKFIKFTEITIGKTANKWLN